MTRYTETIARFEDVYTDGTLTINEVLFRDGQKRYVFTNEEHNFNETCIKGDSHLYWLEPSDTLPQELTGQYTNLNGLISAMNLYLSTL